MNERTKEDRAAWLREALLDQGYAEHRMISEIMNKIGVSRGKAEMWLKGGVGGGELALKFATIMDFVPGHWIWSDYDPQTFLGPNRLKVAKHLRSNMDFEKENALTEKTLRTVMKFITQNYLPPDTVGANQEWQENVIKAFFVFKQTLSEGLRPEQVLELGNTLSQIKNPTTEVLQQ